MSPLSPIPQRNPIRAVLSSPALLRFVPVQSTAALAIAQLGIAAFFVAGIARPTLGDSAPWFVQPRPSFASTRPDSRLTIANSVSPTTAITRFAAQALPPMPLTPQDRRPQ
jgi:hypothetical protein